MAVVQNKISKAGLVPCLELKLSYISCKSKLQNFTMTKIGMIRVHICGMHICVRAYQEPGVSVYTVAVYASVRKNSNLFTRHFKK